jgi:hypothetical protein
MSSQTKLSLVAILAIVFLSPCSAYAGATRSVQPAGKGPQRLAVDAELLAGSADGSLADLRLRDRDGREVPYLLVWPETPEGTWQPARMLPIKATKAESGFELDFNKPLITDRLRVAGLPAPFLKRCRLEGSGDRQHWTLLLAQGSLFSLPDEGLHQLELAFPNGEYRYLRITWDDRMSPRLPLPRHAAAYMPPTGAAPPPAKATVAFSKRASEPGVSRFRLRLPGRNLPVRALELDVGSGHLMREARVLQANLQENELVPVVLGTAQLRRVLKNDVTASAMRIPIERPTELELELRVEDGNNPPLDLKGVATELEPLPWIYFESIDGATLTASCGDGRLTKPQYDLEVMRSELTRLHPAEALWLAAPVSPAATKPELEAVQMDPGPGGPVDRSQFLYVRTVRAAPPGLSALLLDADVLAHSSNLADLRISDGQGQQVQYLLERREEPLSIDLPLPHANTQKGVSTYDIELPQEQLPASRLVIETPTRVFERRVIALEKIAPPAHERTGHLRHQRTSEEPQERYLADATWRHSNPEEAAPSLVMQLPPLQSRTVILRIEEGDNRPLPLGSPRLLLPSYRLRFFHPGAELMLLYGSPATSNPRYDLALLEPRLRGAATQEIEIGEAAQPKAVSEPVMSMGAIFWGVLILAVLVLLIILGRLLKKDTPAPPPAN